MVSQNGPEVLTTQDKEQTKEYKKISAQSEKLENIKTRLNKVDKLNEQESKEIEKELNNVDSEIDSLLQEMDRDTKSNFESEISHVEWLYQSVNTLLEKKVKEELSVLEKSVKRTKESFDKVLDWDEWKKNTRMNVLRATWFTVAGVTAVWWIKKIWKWVKSLFGWKKDKSESKSESKWFWETGIWKTLKYAGLGIGWFLWIRWLVDKFSWKPKPKGDTESQIEGFEKLDETLKWKYEGLGEWVNNFYSSIYSLENSLWFQDEASTGSIVEKEWEEADNYDWVVPYCMDNHYDDVNDIISESGLYSGTRSDWLDQKMSELKWYWEAKLKKYIWPFLWKMKSWLTFNKDWNKTYSEFLNHNPEERKKELESFFRQQIRVTTFLVDKRNALEAYIAEKVVKSGKYKDWNKVVVRPTDIESQNDLVKDLLNDWSFKEQYIESNSLYNSYNNWKLSNAYDILTNNWLLDKSISSPLQKIIQDIDEDSKDILEYQEWEIDADWNTVLDLFAVDVVKGNWLSEINKAKLNDLEENLLEDMLWEEGFMQRNFEYLTYFLNMNDNAKEILMEQWGFEEIFNEYSTELKKIVDEFRQDPTKENLKKLKKLSAKQLALKKEITVSIYTIQSCLSNDMDTIQILEKIWSVFTNIYKWVWEMWDWNLVEWYAKAAPWLFVSWGIIYLVAWRGKTKIWTYWWKALMWVWGAPINLAYKWVRFFGFNSHYWKSRILELKGLKNESHAKDLLRYAIFEWKLTQDHIIALWKRVHGISWINEDKILYETLKKYDSAITEEQSDLFFKYNTDKKLRKLFVTSNDRETWTRWKANLNRLNSRKQYSINYTVLSKIWEINDVINGNAWKNFWKLLSHGLSNTDNITDLTKLKNLSTNNGMMTKINKIDSKDFIKILKYVKWDNLTKLLEWIDRWYDINKIMWSMKLKSKKAKWLAKALEWNVNITDTKTINAIWKAIETEFDAVWTKIKGSWSISEKYLLWQQDMLLDFSDKFPYMTDKQFKAFTLLDSKWLTPLQIVRLKWIMDSPLISSDNTFKFLAKAVEDGNINDMVKYLDSIKWSTGKYSKIIISEAGELSSSLTNIKTAFTNIDEFKDGFKALKWFIKVLAKVT